MILPRAVTTSAFYGFEFEDAPLSRLDLIPNQHSKEDERRTQRYSKSWSGLPVPAGTKLSQGDLVWLAFPSLHDTDPLFVIPDSSEALGEREFQQHHDRPFPIWPEPQVPSIWLPRVYVWPKWLQVGPISGEDKTKPRLWVKSIPENFYWPGRWRETIGRDEERKPIWRIYTDQETGILAFYRAEYEYPEEKNVKTRFSRNTG